ncbi:hypothetical protein LINGRAHAP2_LOCUS6624, partial [Linum grandiflorum]
MEIYYSSWVVFGQILLADLINSPASKLKGSQMLIVHKSQSVSLQNGPACFTLLCLSYQYHGSYMAHALFFYTYYLSPSIFVPHGY